MRAEKEVSPIAGNIYFVGAGGIGMANLVRYFLANGAKVAGYDRATTLLTESLEKEGARIFNEDSEDSIPQEFRDRENTLVVYTPAISEDNRILSYFRINGFEVVKRAALLGKITRKSKGICVAGSHGKTTTSTMIAHILHISDVGCNAFLGGISRNYGSNLLLSESSPYSVIEADEYDRSFHHLSPHIAVITSTDPDHLDIYGNEENYLESFAHFTELIEPGGVLLVHSGLKLKPRPRQGVKTYTYSATDTNADWHAENVTFEAGHLRFDLAGPGKRIDSIELGVPIEINVDNAVAAAAVAIMAGAGDNDIRKGLLSFLGARRRFDIWLRGDDGGPVLIDDYAHSPNEVRASIRSVRKAYAGKRLSVIFQPHLYSRTRDFAAEFADALSEADEVIMPEIYPAREQPIEGVTTELILKDVRSKSKCYCARKDLLKLIKNSNFEILMTLGAADIDVLLPEIKHILTSSKG